MSVLMELEILVPCCFFLVALMKFLYDYLWVPLRVQHMMNSQGIKGPPYNFITTNNKPMALSHDIFPKVQPHIYTWINKYGKNFLYWNGLKNSEQAFPKRTPSIYGRKLLGNGLVFLEGEKWAKHRKLANYAFHGESLKTMTPAIIASVETMMKKWKGQEGKEIEVFNEFRLLTSEVISRTAFGSNYLEGEKIFDMLKKLSIILGRNIFKTKIPFIKYLTCVFYIKIWKTADLLESEKLEKGIHDCVLEIVKKRENKFVSGEVDGFGNDFLGLLVNAFHHLNDKNMLSMEDLVDECKTFYFAGQETVNSYLLGLSCLYSIFSCNMHGSGTFSSTWLHAGQLQHQLSGMMRKVEKEVRLGKLVLPANIDLQIASIAFYYDPQLWGDDVHLFKPERFAEGIAKATNYNTTAFFPSGSGPRSCVGMAFATTEAKIALSMILQRYSFTLSPAYVYSPTTPFNHNMEFK
ncbi:hypothetical protein V6Z11_D02G034600 [Gossypium hirsutum]